MKPSVLLLLAMAVSSAGCVTNSPDKLLSTDSDQPSGEAQTAGQFPVIGNTPVPQISQLTPDEKAAMQAELEQDVQKGRQQAEANGSGDYEAEVLKLRKLAKERERALREQIEGTDPAQ
jgi:hypothetical protein